MYFSDVCTCKDAVFNAVFRLVIPHMVYQVAKDRTNSKRRLNSDKISEQLARLNMEEHEMSHMDFRKLIDSISDKSDNRYYLKTLNVV